jgi:hypothetical protein
LQKELAAAETDLAATKKSFDRTKSDNKCLEHYTQELENGTRVRDTYIEQMNQTAYYSGLKMPGMLEVKSELNDNDAGSSSSSSTFPWLAYPRPIPTPAIPACHLPIAIENRTALLQKYREDVKLAREEEVLMFSEKAAPVIKFVHDEIMEKVRKWKLGDLYPPEKSGWDVY